MQKIIESFKQLVRGQQFLNNYQYNRIDNFMTWAQRANNKHLQAKVGHEFNETIIFETKRGRFYQHNIVEEF